MIEKKMLLILVCVILTLTLMVSAEQSDKSMNSDDVNDSNVAMQAFELRMTGKVDEAIKLLEKAVAANPENGPAQFELARVHFSTTMDAVEQTEGTLKQKQKAMKDKLRLAQETIEKAVRADPANPRYHYWAAKIGTYNAVYDAHFIWTVPSVPIRCISAVKSYEKAIELKPDFHQARQELKGLYERLPWYCGGSKSKAEKYEKLLEQMNAPDDSNDLYDLYVPPPEQMKTRLGIYDSRAIAVAYVHSDLMKKIFQPKMAEMEKAKAAGDKKKIRELDEWGKAQQNKVHRQGFSTAPVDDILEHIKDSLPKIAKDANVIALVSKWDKKKLKRYKGAELVDVTDQIVTKFNPDEKTLKTIEQLKNEKPIPLWQLDIMMIFESH